MSSYQSDNSHRNICVIAGEASGDLQASLLLPHLRQSLHRQSFGEVAFWGTAGPLMRECGVEAFESVENMAAMGFSEVLDLWVKLSRFYKILLKEIEYRRPACVILIDYPFFNLKLAQDVFQLGIPTYYHIPPKFWVHNYKRVHTLARFTHMVTSILPFEVHELHKGGVKNAKFVGNPILDRVHEYCQTKGIIPGESAKGFLSRSDQNAVIGLLPGSRKKEIATTLPVLLKAFLLLEQKFSGKLTGLIPVANTLGLEYFNRFLREKGLTLPDNVNFVESHPYDVMSQVHYAWACSGTATLELNFFGVPCAAIYELSSFSYHISKRIIRVPYVSLSNLCLNECVIPELLQDKMTPENMVEDALSVLADTAHYQERLRGLQRVAALFQPGSGQQAGETIAQELCR